MGLSLRGTTSGAIDINAPAVAGDNTITLPGNNGSVNQFFKNSGTAGIVTYSSMTENSSGDVSITGVSTLGGVVNATSYINTTNGLFSTGLIQGRRTTSTNEVFRGQDSSSNRTSFILGDGRASFLSNVGIGTDNTGVGLLVVHKGASGSNYINITNSATGPASWSNGMLLGNNATGDALVWQNENFNMRFGTNNTDRMTLTEDGNLGIGITDPGAQLHVVDSSATTTDCLKLRNYASGSVNSQPSITFEAVTSGGQGANSHIRGIAGTEAGGLSSQNASGIQFDVRYGGSGTLREAAKFTTDGNLAFPDGQGIDFSATAGGNANSSILDDYEEGTWTPTYGSTTGSFGSITYNIQDGDYTRIGNMVYIECRLRTTAVTVGTAGGGLLVAGLPFTLNSAQGTGGCPAYSNYDLSASAIQYASEGRENSNQFYAAIGTRDDNVFFNEGPGALPAAATAEIRVQFFYKTNS